MSLSKKYAISETTIKAMVKDGVISCSWIGREEVYSKFKDHLTKCGSRPEAMHRTAADMNCSYKHVFVTVSQFEH